MLWSLWLFLSCCFTLMYVLLIGTYIIGWYLAEEAEKSENEPLSQTTVNSSVCIIIPARNEADNIGKCLLSLTKQQGIPLHLLDIIVIDDHSDDETPDLVQVFAARYSYIRLLRLSELLPEGKGYNSYKKKALEMAIATTDKEVIITTDADCFFQENWLSSILSFYEKKQAKMLTGPVCFTGETTFFQKFQTLDFAGMMVATGASHRFKLSGMCNGANLLYKRSVFYEVGGFKGIDNIASGDDMLLMNKISRLYPNDVYFVKNYAATAFTMPQATVKDFAEQRRRWASKSAQYEDKRITFFLAGVYFFNISLLLNALMTLFAYPQAAQLFLAQFMLKSIFDFVFLASGCRFFKRSELLWLFLPAQFLHICYIIIIGTLGNFGQYTWKGRKVK